MPSNMRWDPCVSHRGENVKDFIGNYFSQSSRKTLLISGAGFDPRSHMIPKLFAETSSNTEAIFIQEVRPGPDENLVQLGKKNADELSGFFARSKFEQIEIFGLDNAVTGGRNAVNLVSQYSLMDVTDVVIDTSALSVGVSFPTIRYYFERLSGPQEKANLHVFVAHDPSTDERIKPLHADTPAFIHGFRGGWALDATASAAKLWLPQLAKGRVSTLRRLYNFVRPHDICPILPFPSANPRMGDELSEHYLTELDDAWEVDTRNLIYAAENDPLDLYRTILKIDDRRKPVFSESGGSLLILSPSGSKILSLGALMSSLERDLPIAYLESVGYEFKEVALPFQPCEPHLVHVWLHGEVYP